ncbi:MAG: hypothetical protein M3Z35_07790, partial [Nitrospirota bacterium]|nr:hypothetical protein [Nitrospirota bacterium]
LEVMQGRPYRTLQDADRVASMESIVRELRLTGGYTVRSDHFSVSVIVTINDVTKNANAVLRRSGVNGETSELYFRIE